MRIITINHAARELLDLHQPAAGLLGRPIGDVIQAQPNFFAAAQLGQDTHDEVCRFNHVRVIASRVRIMQEQELQGWVISFRDKNDINTLSSQLSQVKRYADNLRIMRHEQLNWTRRWPGCCICSATTRLSATWRPSRRAHRKSSISSRSASARRRCAACCWANTPAPEKRH